MKTLFCLSSFAIAVLIVMGCNDDESVPAQPAIEGHYEGTFERDGMTARVNLILENGQFSGSSDGDRFPAICNGAYNPRNGHLVFTDSCAWTADFDWTLILAGEWDIQVTKDALLMSKDNGDKYSLIRQ